jgi:hypothetical protein
MPVRSLEEVDEIDAERLFCLAHLPARVSAVSLQRLAEPPHLVRHGLIQGRSRQKPPHPAHKIRRHLLPYQLRFQQELPTLLQRRLPFTYGSPRRPGAPLGDSHEWQVHEKGALRNALRNALDTIDPLHYTRAHGDAHSLA